MPKRKSQLSTKTSAARRMTKRIRNETEEDRQDRLRNVRIRYHCESVNNQCERPISRNPFTAFCYDPNFDYINQLGKIGKMDIVCTNCKAKKWLEEPNGICCSAGKVILSEIQEPPQFFKSLLLGLHPLSKHFMKNLRQYNMLFQMTSFGAKEIHEGNFMPTFKIQGQVYHLIGSLLPLQGNSPKFLQIYFVSDADQISIRSNIVPNLKTELIEQLQSVLQDNNKYIRSFKYNFEENHNTSNMQLIIHADRVPVNQHRGCYNSPTTNEVAVLLVDEDKGPRDIVLHSRQGNLVRVSELHRAYDPLQYPLIFVRGEDGYCLNIQQENVTRNKSVSCMQFYAFRLMVRENSFNTLHYFRNLFSQYCVDMMAKMITERLDFIRRNQKKLRAESYIHLRDAVNGDAEVDGANIGQYIILPSSFTGSPRYMHERTQDAMTYVRNYGRPDLFITFTCNPEWQEIKEELFSGQISFHRHDIISRVFYLKLKKLIKLITNNEIFGIHRCYMYTIEWQKRGLPHCHILLWLQSKIQPDQIDTIISAELPDKRIDPLLFDIVVKNMIHGPCGKYNSSSPCMKNGICSKRYPRNLIAETQTGDDGYPTYRRRALQDGGCVATLNIRGRTVTLDNKWVVPYSPVLCRCFNAHINVEYCNSVKAIKYICKYVNKGSDQATFSIQNKNEVENYINGRYISTSEAVWRLLEFPIHERYPTVLHLAVHLENGQRVYFTPDNVQQIVESPPQTTLTAFFELCIIDDFAKQLLYHEVPHYYVWNKNKFSRRKRGENVEGYPGIKKDAALGRIYNIHPNHSECFYLRMLLQHVRGPTSFQCLKTVNGQVMETYQAACKGRGLLEGDEQWESTLADAAVSKSPSKLRELFVIVLLFCQPSEPHKLWGKFKKDLSEDIWNRVCQQHNDMSLQYTEDIFNEALIQIEDKLFELNEKKLTDFGLPSPYRISSNGSSHLESVLRRPYDTNELNYFLETNLPKLVSDQQEAFDIIMDSVDHNRGNVFFIDAPGGTGKTFLTNLLLAKVRSSRKIALAVASSGIAATLLSGGRTAHSTFKLPLSVSLQQESVCSIRKNGPLGKVLQEVSLIIWDECTMSHRAHIEAVDRTLRDIRNCSKILGGLTFVFCGDFRQTLPVIVKGTRADIVKACLKSSSIWRYITTLNLRTNMRAHLGGGDNDFQLQLLCVGDGKFPNDNGFIKMDAQLGNIVLTVSELINKVYPNVGNLLQNNYNWFCERAILSPRNVSVNEINDIVLKMLPGNVVEYKSIDTVVNVEDTVHYPQEFLNSLNPSGLPSHCIKLKIGTPIMLLRNLQPPNLCNGTRLQVKALRDNVIETIILTGPAVGQSAHIPRIPMIPNDLPFAFKRLQFPINISFAITVNKSQGQTFKYVGLDLRLECFSHGQLYVGLSRSGSSSNQYILLPNDNKTKNVVYAEAL